MESIFVPGLTPITKETRIDLFSINGFNIGAYPVIMTIGFIIAILTIAFFWHREKWSWTTLLILIIITVPSALIGARFLYIIQRLLYPAEGIADGLVPISQNWWDIRSGGLAIQGGVLFAAVADGIYLYFFKRKEINFWKAFGIILPAVLVGQGIGRWGNFMNHEVFGEIVPFSYVSWLGPWISHNMYIFNPTTGLTGPRVPLFLYEFMGDIGSYLIIVWGFTYFGWSKPGMTGAFYFISYGLIRALMEGTRESDESFPMYQTLAILMLVGGIILAIYLQWFQKTKFKIVKKSHVKYWYVENKGKKSYQYINSYY